MPRRAEWRPLPHRRNGGRATRGFREDARLPDGDRSSAEVIERRNSYLSDESGNRRFETAQILLPRRAMVAVLHEGEVDIAGGESFDKIERVAPRHVGVAHALQDANRQIERKRALADQVFSSLPDHPPGGGEGGA